MMYTEEQVRIARHNDEMSKDCPTWLREMFGNAPHNKTMAKCHHSWESGFRGNDDCIVYRISDDWPSKSEIFVPHWIPELKPVDMFVSNNEVTWVTASVIGRLGNSVLAVSNFVIKRWAYVKPIIEQEYSVNVKIRIPTQEVNVETVTSAIGDGIADYLEVESVVEVKEVS